MEIFIKENTWAPDHLKFDFGWGNGYVAIPKGHSLHGKDYDEIHELIPELSVNGGLTFADSVENIKEGEKLKNIKKDDWIVGFDTSHYGDTLEKWSKEAVLEETKSLKTQLENYGKD